MSATNHKSAGLVWKYTLVGALCGTAGPVVSIVIAYAGRVHPKECGIPVMLLVFLVALLLPLGAMIGAIVGLFRQESAE